MQPLSVHNEQELFLRIAEGDEAAFTILFHTYLPQLQAFAIKLTKSEAVAQELIQDIFLRIWLKRDTLTEIENPRAWLYRLASNDCFGYLRRQLTHSKVVTEIGRSSSGQADDTADYAELRELRVLIARAVDLMPPQRKKIYQMSRVQGMKVKEIADELGLSTATVKNVLVTAMKFIREFLAQSGHHLALIFSILINF